MTTITQQEPLKLQWVSDIIGQEYLQWGQGNAVIIDCQTGTGKSAFILNKLVRHCRRNHLTMLYICNRKALKQQVKMDILKNLGGDIPSNEELEHMDIVSGVKVVSYQQITNKMCENNYKKEHSDISEPEIKWEDYNYIVYDECHYVWQDASFNNTTDVFLFDYIMDSKTSVSIFMSATMNIMKSNIMSKWTEKVWIYETGRDYSYLDVKYFKKDVDIINTINNSEEKWILFIDNTKKAIAMLSKINDSKFVCAENSKHSKKMCEDTRDNIIDHSFFECKCLMATKALDNGINITDPSVKNVVIITTDQVDFIQMLGRKRIDINNPERVNLYIQQRGIKTFYSYQNTIIKKTQSQLDEFSGDKIAFTQKYDRNYHKLSKGIFFKDNNSNEWQRNRLAANSHLVKKWQCEYMIQQFQLDGDSAFIYEQLDWIGHKYNKVNWISEVVDDKKINTLEEYLLSIVGNVILEQSNRTELIEKIGLIDSHNSSKKNKIITFLKTINTLNSYLDEVNSNFRIKQFETSRMIDGKKKKYKSAWKVMRLTE